MGMLDFRSRAERERDYQAFFKRVFPEGNRRGSGWSGRFGSGSPGRTSPM